ncbi:DUF6292 family protein [Rhodococcus wratislaviensis]|uniref:DUF6292 domain-containing protein n=1 Tax=Rhodococcus wratislaviensis NBRC 100605 TaxID=1219028 RepID=X0QY91_RHOWR|nr:DUF6292 family protein [Rhodococcus wratislaviensis]GAF43570.1 hypothetical protein RW1_008_00030 [Rhodococcus wratislaviensis NBRC 100605]
MADLPHIDSSISGPAPTSRALTALAADPPHASYPDGAIDHPTGAPPRRRTPSALRTSQTRATSSAEAGAYVGSVASTMEALSVDWWYTPAFDVVVTLPCEIPYYRGRKAVLAWNRHFGWSLGVHGLTRGNVLVVEGLGLGPAPDAARCSDRVAELIAELANWAPSPASGKRAPRIVHGPGAPHA